VILESKASALGVFFWSPKLKLWNDFGVQSFSFGMILESKALALGIYFQS
jgi:hypothetical protein